MSITKIQAIEIAQSYIQTHPNYRELDLLLDYKRIIEKEYGWVFFYNTRKFLEAGNFLDSLVGNSPFLVENKEGKLYVFGTARSVNWYLYMYEKNAATENPILDKEV